MLLDFNTRKDTISSNQPGENKMKIKLVCFLTLLTTIAVFSIANAAPQIKPSAPKKITAKLPAPSGDRGFTLKTGLMGGAAAASIGYRLANASLSAGYGSGNKYTEMISQIELSRELKYFDLGLSIDYVNYTSKVRNIFGLSGDIDKGPHLGIGLSLNKNFNKFNASLGYSTVMGALATIGYKF
jgi:hypothetical protein